MPSEEEDLVKKLSARLSGEIENLPKDGTDHAFTVKIKGNRGHINLGGSVINFVFGHNMLQRCMYADQKETGQ